MNRRFENATTTSPPPEGSRSWTSEQGAEPISPGARGPRSKTPGAIDKMRLFPITYTILGINIAVFLAWQLAGFKPTLAEQMIVNFTVSAQHLQLGLVWTLLTAAFSHEGFVHMLFNSVVLLSFGRIMERVLGRARFTGFYLVAALVLASASHCLLSVVVLDGADIKALGASGALAGVLMAFSLLFPKEKILLFGAMPLPALVAALAFVAFDVVGLIGQSLGRGLPLGHGAHLGGALCGAVLYFAYLRPRLGTLKRPAPANSVPLSEQETAELDRLKNKIELEGTMSLTPKEQHFLRQMHERFSR